MCTIYQKYFLKSAETLFGSDRICWVLQKENDSKDRGKLCCARKRQNVTAMQRPAMSQEANPIENLWSYNKMNLK